MKDNLRRIRALTVKEFREVLRDNSSLALGILLPIILILVIGYGISLDVKHAPIGVVLKMRLRKPSRWWISWMGRNTSDLPT